MAEPRPTLRRPLTLRPVVARRIVAELRRGNFLGPAAARAGVTSATAYRWRQRGAARANAGKLPPPDLVAYLLPPPGELPAADPPATPSLAGMAGRLAWLLAFAVACDLAEGELECGAVGVLYDAARANPQVLLAFLARRFPERWAPRQVVAAGVQAVGGATTLEAWLAAAFAPKDPDSALPDGGAGARREALP